MLARARRGACYGFGAGMERGRGAKASRLDAIKVRNSAARPAAWDPSRARSSARLVHTAILLCVCEVRGRGEWL